MAYNFFPTGYQPYQVSQPQNASSLIWVQGEGAAKSFPVAPNTSVALWDSEANVAYIKSADASGMPSIRTLDYTVRENTPRRAETAPQAEFATKEDISHLKEEIDAVKAKFAAVNKHETKEKKDGK